MTKAIVEMVFMLTMITIMFIILIIMHWIRVIEHVHIYTMVFMLTVIAIMFIILISMHWVRVMEHVHIYSHIYIYASQISSCFLFKPTRWMNSSRKRRNKWTEPYNYLLFFNMKNLCSRFAEKVMVDNLQLLDSKEGINAFIDKRKPQWKS